MLLAYLRNFIFTIIFLCFSLSAQAQDSDYEFGVLYNASGVEETFYGCTACHSERIIAQQGLPRDGWIESLEWMVEEQGMPVIEEPDYSIIINYLSEHYNIDRPHFSLTKK